MVHRSLKMKPLQIFRRSVILLIGVVFIGAAGFYFIETNYGDSSLNRETISGPPKTLLDAIYWAIESITTTGYGDVIPTTRVSRLFVMMFSIVSVLTAAWAGAHALAFIVEGHLSQVVRERKMNKAIHSLQDHYIVCGLGRVGQEIIKEFQSSKVDFVVIDKSKEAVEGHLQEDDLFLIGDTTDDETLKSARVETARGLVTCFPSDADTVFTILSAKGLNPRLFVIARGQYEASRSKLLRAGADRVVLPSHIGGRRMAAMALRPAIVEFLDQTFQVFGDREPMLLEEMTVAAENPFIGKMLKDTHIKSLTDVMIMGIKQKAGEFLLNPPSDYIIDLGDTLIGLGRPSHFQKLRKIMGI